MSITKNTLRRGGEDELIKVPVGIRPNGLSYDPDHKLLLAANVGDPAIALV